MHHGHGVEAVAEQILAEDEGGHEDERCDRRPAGPEEREVVAGYTAREGGQLQGEYDQTVSRFLGHDPSIQAQDRKGSPGLHSDL